MAASDGSEFRSVLVLGMLAPLATSGKSRSQKSGCHVKILDMTAGPVLDKPLDLSRDPASTSTEVLMLTDEEEEN